MQKRQAHKNPSKGKVTNTCETLNNECIILSTYIYILHINSAFLCMKDHNSVHLYQFEG